MQAAWRALQSGVAGYLWAPHSLAWSWAEKASELDSWVEVLIHMWSLACFPEASTGCLSALKTTLSWLGVHLPTTVCSNGCFLEPFSTLRKTCC